jgi:uncharacterized membrane protein YdbT with pleckstrin-like domain
MVTSTMAGVNFVAISVVTLPYRFTVSVEVFHCVCTASLGVIFVVLALIVLLTYAALTFSGGIDFKVTAAQRVIALTVGLPRINDSNPVAAIDVFFSANEFKV